MPPRSIWHWREFWLRIRNRFLSDARFHRFALGFPLFRPISRARSRHLFDLVAGFVYSQVLYTCVHLDLFSLLALQPHSAEEVAKKIGWTGANTQRLLGAAVALDLLEEMPGCRFGLGIHGAALLGNPWIARFVEHHGILYKDLADPVSLLRGDAGETGLGRYWAYARSASPQELTPQMAAGYTALMAASQAAIAQEILDAYDFSRHRTLLDVGGGDGSFVTAAAARHPALNFVLFDLPAVSAKASLRLEGNGLAGRIRIESGNFLTDPLPRDADAAILVRVVHDHDDPAAIKIMSSIRQALPLDGCLIVAEPLAGIRWMKAVTDAYFNIYLSAMGSGRTRTVAEVARLGKAAGFHNARAVHTRNPLLTSLIVLKN